MNKKILNKTMAVILAFGIAVGLGGCRDISQSSEINETSVDKSTVTIKGKEIEAGNVSAICPDGWKSVGVPDYSASDADTLSTDKLRFINGGSSAEDATSYPTIEISCYNADYEEEDPENVYGSVTEIESFSTGNYTWEGYTGTSLGVSFTHLSTTDGSHKYIVMLYELSNIGNGEDAAVSDSDVQGILASIEAE